METSFQIVLSADEALVLFEMLSRFRETNKLSLENNAEFIALSAISTHLESTLVEPFQSNYEELLQQAQSRLADGCEMLMPGVPGYEEE